jgi:NADPH:quinone reductase-like Zn-dependent oxidoreductase
LYALSYSADKIDFGDFSHDAHILNTCCLVTRQVTVLLLSKPQPQKMTVEEAAAVPLACLTAFQMLQKAGFKKGDQILITAGAGGVGHYAIQVRYRVSQSVHLYSS